ncbi:hypothetical protein OSB04_018063 [Centaurea solstitialis]|uniref:Glycosyltransferase n=1 Tax=Centaurea solstitialis TaxID=347529 RepID=A0AA38TP21_9ASTR|nr:hypothetical protein OSB04_018063 [Centaurea solstitialis]
MASNLHFLMIPLMCPGHLIPMVDMAKIIAQHQVTVTIVITPRNAQRYGSVLDRAITSGLPIRVLKLPFPASESGLPDQCESFDDLPSFNLSKNFADACAKLQQPLEKLVGELNPTPNCIISDKHLAWTADVAEKHHIPWLSTHNLFVSKVHEKLADSDLFTVPGLPDKVVMTKSQLPELLNPGDNAKSKEMKMIIEHIRATESRAYGTLINSFEALEGRYVDEYKKLKQGKVWCIGPFSQSNENDLDKAQRGSRASINDHDYMKWLDSQRPGSVVYACFGSLTRLTPSQFIELALGLEESRFPFILALNRRNQAEEIEKWVAEDGFEERVKGRGVLVRGWAPQVLILSHPAVGAFLTHCGWNSTIEGLCAGVPMVTWPQFEDQFFNERVVVQVAGTGVAVGARTAVPYLAEEGAVGVQVKREDVCKAVKVIMVGGLEAEERREKAKYFKEMAKKAMKDDGSSKINLKLFIQDIMITHK